jgi:transposase
MQTNSTGSQIKKETQNCSENDPSSTSEQNVHTFAHNSNSQVTATKQRAPRRKFSMSDKRKFLETYDAIDNPESRGEFLRENGLYSASITKWRKQLSDKQLSRANTKSTKLESMHNKIVRENSSLKKKLAQAEAIIDLQKKVSELLSLHVLKPEMNEDKS